MLKVRKQCNDQNVPSPKSSHETDTFYWCVKEKQDDDLHAGLPDLRN